MNKTMNFFQTFRLGKSAWFAVFTLIYAVMVSSCSSDEELGDITGTYGKLTGDTDTEIIITQNSNGYSMKCRYYEYSESTEEETDITWQGTFQNTPSDIVKDGSGKEIGSISFSSGEATFKATTQRPGTYKAYKDELADLPRSRMVQK